MGDYGVKGRTLVGYLAGRSEWLRGGSAALAARRSQEPSLFVNAPRGLVFSAAATAPYPSGEGRATGMAGSHKSSEGAKKILPKNIPVIKISAAQFDLAHRRLRCGINE
jgi:hypothetical protein